MSNKDNVKTFSEGLEKSWQDYRDAQKVLLDRDRPRYERVLAFLQSLIPFVEKVQGTKYIVEPSEIRLDLANQASTMQMNIKVVKPDGSESSGFHSFSVSSLEKEMMIERKKYPTEDVSSEQDAVMTYLHRQFGPTQTGTYTPIPASFPLKP